MLPTEAFPLNPALVAAEKKIATGFMNMIGEQRWTYEPVSDINWQSRFHQ